MTVIGIGGCTALIVTGFGLHSSIFAILDKQFDEVSVYDATVGLDSHSTAQELEQAAEYLDNDENVERWLACRQISVDASAGGLTHTAYIFAVEDQEAFRQMIDLRERKSGASLEIEPDGVVITEKLSELLDLQVGDTITLEGDRRVEATVTAIAENYVYHYVYMTESFYEQLFRENAEENVILLAYGDGVDSQRQNDTSVALMKLDAVSSYSYIGTIRDTFTKSMSAIDYAVVIIIVAAAALAFVVLYNLTNINITERVRELATLKVLGFYDGETTAYIYRENIFLTVFGILLGLVMGRFLHAWLVRTVEVDLVMFGRTAPPYAYWLAAGLTVLFSVIVNIFAHFRLKKVDMVESLKTVE
jgi:putative ABC transport system permease protein